MEFAIVLSRNYLHFFMCLNNNSKIKLLNIMLVLKPFEF